MLSRIMFAPAAALALGPPQKQQLEALARAGTTPQRLARRCQVIVLASQGVANRTIAQQTALARPIVLATRVAFARGVSRRSSTSPGVRAPGGS